MINSHEMPPLRVGATAEITRVINEEMVREYAHLTGDTNPIHLDAAYAAVSRFERRVAHGMLVSGVISAVLGTKLPGPGAVYLSQTLQFRAPVFLGDRITATVELVTARADKPVFTFRTNCRNQDGAIVIEGEAALLVPAVP